MPVGEFQCILDIKSRRPTLNNSYWSQAHKLHIIHGQEGVYNVHYFFDILFLQFLRNMSVLMFFPIIVNLSFCSYSMLWFLSSDFVALLLLSEKVYCKLSSVQILPNVGHTISKRYSNFPLHFFLLLHSSNSFLKLTASLQPLLKKLRSCSEFAMVLKLLLGLQ